MILIDNYDSFTYNIVQYLKELGVEPKVFKNDKKTVNELKKIDFSSIIISPGPGNPDNSGVSMDVIGEFYKTKKILGVCLGHQCIAQYFGCKIIQAKEPCHGKVSKIYFNPDPLFEGIKQGFEATRYHSLIVDNDSLTDEIMSLAYAEENGKWKMENGKLLQSNKIDSPYHPITLSPTYHSLLMSIKHKNYPVYGVQFHPEAILTQHGKKLLENFISI